MGLIRGEGMTNSRHIREPKQSRSIQMKEIILETALKLFCEKGFYKTSTNEIARAAGVNIASLYSYFVDRDAIFFEILDRYHHQFVGFQKEWIATLERNGTDRKEWLYKLIEGLVAVHEQSKAFNKELKVLYYSNDKVAATIDKQKKETQEMITKHFLRRENELKVDDLEAAAIVTFNMVSSIVDEIVFSENSISRERILRAGVEAVFKYLMF